MLVCEINGLSGERGSLIRGLHSRSRGNDRDNRANRNQDINEMRSSCAAWRELHATSAASRSTDIRKRRGEKFAVIQIWTLAINGLFVAQRMDRLGACDRQRMPEDCRQRDKKCCCSRSKKR